MIKALAELYNSLKNEGRIVEAEELLDLIIEAQLEDEGDWFGEDDYKDPRVQEDRRPKEFRVPTGFSAVSQMNRHFRTNEPANADAYSWERATKPSPGDWNTNNGTIALCDQRGDIYCWLPKDGPRTVPFEKAMELLLDGGYKRKQFYVPFSN